MSKETYTHQKLPIDVKRERPTYVKRDMREFTDDQGTLIELEERETCQKRPTHIKREPKNEFSYNKQML